MKNKILRTDRLLAALVAMLALFAAPQAHAQLYTSATNTGVWNSGRWSTSSNAANFTNSWSNNFDVIFLSNTVYSFTGAGGTTPNIGNITLQSDSTVRFSSTGGTLGFGGAVRTLDIGAGAVLDLNGNNVSTAAGTGFIKTGDGVFGTGAGTYQGGFTLNGGTVSIRGNTGLGSGATNVLTLSNGVLAANASRSLDSTRFGGGIRLYGNIQVGALSNSYGTNAQALISDTAALSFANNVDLGGGTRTMTIGNNAGHTFSGVISNGALTIAAASGVTGTMTLSGANTYTGKTTVSSGTLILSGSGRAGATSSDLEVAGGLLNLSTGTKTNAAFTLSGGTITNGTLQATTYALQGGTIISNATLGTGTATVTAGTTTLNGLLNATTVNVNSGTLNLGAADRLANGAAVTIGGGTLGMGANNDEVSTFTMTNGTLGGTTGILTASSYALQGGTINARLGAGAITVATGTTTLGSAGRLDTSSTLAVNSGQLDLGGNEAVAAISGAGGTVNVGANTLTFGGNNANTTYSGAITGSGGGIIKAGSGRTVLAGNSSYTGATTINAGTLAYNGTNTSTAVAVNTGSTLIGTGSVGATTINSGGTMNPGMSPGTQTYSSLIWESGGNYNWELHDASAAAGTGYDTFVSTGAFTINATSGSKFNINLWTLSSINPSDVNGEAVNFTGTSSYSWTLGTFGSISGFDATKFTINTVATNGTGGFANPFNGTFAISTNSTELLLVYTAPVLGSDYIWNAGSGLWGTAGNWTNNASPTNGASIIYAGAGGASTNQGTVNSISGLLFSNTAGSYTISGDALTVGAAGIDNESTSAQTIDNNLTLGAAQSFLAANGDLIFGGTVSNAGFLLTVAGANDTAINGAISGAGGLTKTGAGSLTLAGANSYAGGTTVNAGTLVGSTTSLQGNIANTSFLEFNQAGDGSYAGAISGAGVVTKSGAGNVTFSGANTYNGGTIVSGGTLTGSTATVPGDVDVNSGATFALSQTTNGTFSGLIEGAGRFVKSGSGDVTLSGANTYSGGTLVSGGTLTGTTSSLQGNITNNAAVVFNQASAGTYAGAMSGNGSLTKSGAATLTLSGANSYSGGTLVSAGALEGSTASLQGSITNNATVVMNQTTNGSYNGAMSGNGALAKAGSGTVTLGGNNSSYSGAIDLQAGGLIAANNNALGSSSVTLTNGSIQAANGVSIANNFTIGSAPQTSYGSSVSLAGWDFSTIAAGTAGNANNFGPSPFSGTYDAAVTSSGLVRPNGHTATNTGVAGAWGGNDWQATSAAQAVTDEDYVTFTLQSSSNLLALDSIIAYNVRRSSTGATSGQWQYSTNGATFTDIGSVITWGSTTTATGNAQSAISLSNISGLQGIAEGTTVTFRILTYGGTAQAGTWYLKDLGNGTTNDFGVVGKLGTLIAGSGSGALGIGEAGAATFSGNIANNSAATLTAATGGTAIFSGALSGLGTVTKTGAGTVTLSGASANTFSGMTTVSAGTLQLNKTAETDAIAGDIEVNDGAFLLLSSSGNVADTSEITLSGGTILRDGGVSEVFGALTLGPTGGTLDFGTGATGTLGFGEYAPSALLTINNFFQGNTLTFGSDLSGSINNTALFSFDNGFTSNWSSGTSTFTITAIPEPSTYLAAAGLLSLMLWPSRKRIVRDAKKILGFTPPMRDRLAARREQRSKVEARNSPEELTAN
jgi:autotransporter-associated beta strand protein